jgi:hypothetical protein
MTFIRANRSFRAFRIVSALLATGFWLSAPAQASLIRNLSGNINISGVDSKSAEESNRSLNQRYSAYWTKGIGVHLVTRASIRYFDVGVDRTQGGNSWRRQYQPAGEIFWKHPDFSISGSVSRQVSTSNAQTTDLVRDQAALALTTRLSRYPMASLRFGWDRTANQRDRAQRDTQQRQALLNLNYSVRSEDLYYSLAYRVDDNYATTLRSTNINNLFRWGHVSRHLSDRLRLKAAYNFIHRYQETDRPGGNDVYIDIPVTHAIYARDATPDFGSLDTLGTLDDGNVADPASPAIDIGAGMPDHNLGVDFGYEREVSAFYIYTDRPSGTAVGWDVYVSADNLTWTMIAGRTSSQFNVAFSRYEITFDSCLTRYLKAVNTGNNDLAPVFVTEVQALVDARGRTTDTRREASHLVEVGAGYTFSPKLESSVDLTARKEPRGNFSNSRDQVYYAWSLKHTPLPRLTQAVRYQGGIDDFKAGTRNSLATVSYTALYAPLPRLEFSFAAGSRSNYIDHMKSQEINNLQFRTGGEALSGLTVSGNVAYSRTNQFDAQKRFDVWSYHVSTEAVLTQSLTVAASYDHQTTRNVDTRDGRRVHTYTTDVDWRLTRSILARAALLAQRDKDRYYYSQEYALSWVMSRKVSAGATAVIIDGDHNFHSARNSIRLNYAVGPRTSLFASYADNEFSPSAGNQGTSIQVGLNTGF